MKSKTAIFFLMCTLMMWGTPSQAKNRALLIGVSDYSTKYSWPHINSTNDIALISKALKGFKVKQLTDSKATYSNIVTEMNLLCQQSKPGDVVYIHLSGHGQPVEDMNSDEADGWDESFVPYDAAQIYGEAGYTGGKHLIDDELNDILTRLRNKVGNKGMVYVVVDACHAGTMRRGDEDALDEMDGAPMRGTNQGFSKTKFYRPKRDQKQKDHFLVEKKQGESDIIILEACGANQKNQEVKVDGKFYGPLSYSLYKVISKEGFGKDSKWWNKIQGNMKALAEKARSNQTMVIETSIK